MRFNVIAYIALGLVPSALSCTQFDNSGNQMNCEWFGSSPGCGDTEPILETRTPRAGLCGSGPSSMIGQPSATPKPIARTIMATLSRRAVAMRTAQVAGLDTSDSGARSNR